MSENLLVEEIKKLGLNSYEAKVYLALMERDSLSPAEISRISRVPRARVYDILDNLIADGLATLKPGKHKRYSAADPDTFGEKLFGRNEKHYADQKKTIEKVTLTLKRKFESAINSGGHRSDPLDYIEIIKDPFQMHKMFIKLIDDAKKEVLVFSKPPYTGSRKKIEEQFEQQVEPLRRGINIKGIYEIPTEKSDIEWKFQNINRANMHGEKARVIKDLPMKMGIFDDKIALIALVDPIQRETSFTTQIIRHSALAKTLKITFDTLWEQAEDYHVLEGLLKNM